MEGLQRNFIADDAQDADSAGRPEITVAVHRVEIERTGTGQRGDRYRVTHNGAVIVESSTVPEFDVCRALQAMGHTGTLATFSPGYPRPRMRLDIAAGAKLTVSETSKIGPRFTAWRPFDRSMITQDAEPEAE